jgi:hypothetical protein
MNTTIKFAGLFASMCVILFVSPAYPNGRTSPRPADMVLVTAICEGRSDESRHKILRARIISTDGPTTTLNIRVGTASEQLPIPQIKILELPDDNIDSEGFMRGVIIRYVDNREVKIDTAIVQVTSDEFPIFIVGFTANGEKISVPLNQCKRVSFSK